MNRTEQCEECRIWMDEDEGDDGICDQCLNSLSSPRFRED